MKGAGSETWCRDKCLGPIPISRESRFLRHIKLGGKPMCRGGLDGPVPSKKPEEKARIVLAVIKGEMSITEAARRYECSPTSITNWRDQFVEGGMSALAANARHGPTTKEQELERELEDVKTALGEAHVELRVWRKGGALYPGSRSSR